MRKILVSVGVVALTSSFTASAGGYCSPNASGASAFDCEPGVVVRESVGAFDDVTVNVRQPMGHLRSVYYQRSPNVSLTRVHGMGPTAALDDFPSAFTGGCHPSSTQYCRAEGPQVPQPITPQSAAPQPQPIVSQPIVAPAPAFQASAVPSPVAQPLGLRPLATTIHRPMRSYTASFNDDPSRFIPRVYGDPSFVPGIANVPTSYVDRHPGAAQDALNRGPGGITPAAQAGFGLLPEGTPGPQFNVPVAPMVVTLGGVVTAPHVDISQAPHVAHSPVRPSVGQVFRNAPPVLRAPVTQAPVVQSPVLQAPVRPSPLLQAPLPSAPVVQAPVVQAPIVQPSVAQPPVLQAPIVQPPLVQAPAPQVGAVNLGPNNGLAGAPVQTSTGLYASTVGADGTYWEKTSGLTMFGDTVATQVICKRALPQQEVNPVIGVPQPVPYPVECEVPVESHSRYGAHLGH